MLGSIFFRWVHNDYSTLDIDVNSINDDGNKCEGDSVEGFS
jgi:hypothetical protein